jgi:hypothetical protein
MVFWPLGFKNFQSSAKKEPTEFGTRLKVLLMVFLALLKQKSFETEKYNVRSTEIRSNNPLT